MSYASQKRKRLSLKATRLAMGLAAGMFCMSANATIMNYTVTLQELNDSGVSGNGTLAFDDATNMLSVNYTVSGLDSGVHPQHIHGLFAGGIGVPGGTPADASVPTLADDADGDGVIEVLEAAGSYGDILLSLTQTPGAGDFPDTGGVLNYSQVFDLTDVNVFQPASIATGNTYSMADLFPLELREIVIHGGVLEEGVGAGTQGEADGSGGYKAVLPVAAGEIVAAAVPVPGTFAMFGLGLVSLTASGLRRRQRRSDGGA